jgi:glycosyltransferase involved in cell wall biosynthesis
MTPLNILIFEPYPFNRIAGNLRTQSYILESVDKETFRLILLAPLRSEFTDKVQNSGIDTIVLEPGKRVNRYGGKCLRDGYFGKILTVFSLFSYNLKLYRIFKRRKVDIVYCNCIRGVLTVGLAAIMTRSKILWYIKGELQNPILDTTGFVLSKKILYFCQSNIDDKYPALVKMFGNKIGILKIGLDLKTIEAVEQADKSDLIKKLGIDQQKINCIYIGQVYAPKGIHFLLEAIALVKDEFPDIRLYIVGDHVIEEYRDYKKELVKIIEKHGMSENIIFTGWRPDALNIVSLMDILIHPSLSEGFGRAVLEGMALGKPVIASSVGGLREIIKDGENGFLVEPGDPQMIAEKLRLLLLNKNLRDNFGKAARDTVFSEYLIQDKITQLEAIWYKMAKTRNSWDEKVVSDEK